MAGTHAHVDPGTLKSWLDERSAVVVDVREADEHAAERIAGARPVPLSRFDPTAVPAGDGPRVVLCCRSGKRAAEAAGHLVRAGRSDVWLLEGGLEAWKAAGLPVEFGRGPHISILRQVQITAGGLVVAGTILGATVSPWFLLLSGGVGAGLMFAGISGTCGLASVLARMPWNRVSG